MLSRVTKVMFGMLFAFIGVANAECQRYEGYKTNVDGTVTDPRTNLIWTRCNIGQSIVNNGECIGNAVPISLFDAINVAGSQFDPSVDTWRIPTSSELLSMLDSNCTSKRTNEEIFSIPTDAADYWSSERARYGTAVWYVNGNSGELNLTMNLSDRKLIRLVKGGSNMSRNLFKENAVYLIDNASSLKAWESDRQEARDLNDTLLNLFKSICTQTDFAL